MSVSQGKHFRDSARIERPTESDAAADEPDPLPSFHPRTAPRPHSAAKLRKGKLLFQTAAHAQLPKERIGNYYDCSGWKRSPKSRVTRIWVFGVLEPIQPPLSRAFGFMGMMKGRDFFLASFCHRFPLRFFFCCPLLPASISRFAVTPEWLG